MVGSHGNPLFNFEFKIFEVVSASQQNKLADPHLPPLPQPRKGQLFIYLFFCPKDDSIDRSFPHPPQRPLT